jgi:hypothetical protein
VPPRLGRLAAVALKRLVLLAAGAGAVWYAKQKLSENGSAQPLQQAQGQGRTEPQPVEPPIETTAFQEPEVEPRVEAPAQAEEPPVAFEDARQEGWDDEQLGKDPKNLDELEIDPATAGEAEEDTALEDAEELPEDEHDRTLEHQRTEPAHVTRVVDDLLEGRRDEVDESEIEDATLVEEDRDQGQ